MNIVESARQYLDVRETPPGSNRNPVIDRWLKAVGAPLGSPWCAAAAFDWITEAGLKPPKKSGRVQDWVDAVGVSNLLSANAAQVNDIIVFWFASLKRYAHIGIVTGRSAGAIQTIEANTIPTGFKGDSREGFGCFEHTLQPSDRLKIIRL